MSNTFELIDKHNERCIDSYSRREDAENDRMNLMLNHFQRTMGEMEKLAKSPIKRAKKTIKVDLDHPDADQIKCVLLNCKVNHS